MRKSFPFVLTGILIGISYVLIGTHLGALFIGLFSLAFGALYFYSKKISSLHIFLLGLTTNLVGFHWLEEVINYFGEMSSLKAWALSLLLFSLCALQFVFVNALYRGLQKTPLQKTLLSLPLAWVSIEVLLPKLIPWELGAPLLSLTPIAQAADLVGLPLLSFFLLWWSLLFWKFLETREKKPAAALLLSLLLCLLYGNYQIDSTAAAIKTSPKITLGIVQGNLDPIRDFHYNRRLLNIEKHRKLSQPLLAYNDLDLLIWAESTVGFDYFEYDKQITPGDTRDPFPGARVPLLFGGQVKLPEHQGGEDRWYNSAILMTPERQIAGMYHKQHLFPFSERMPLSDYFPWLKKLLDKEYLMVEGENQRILQSSISSNKKPIPEAIRFATVICYEDLVSKYLWYMIKEEEAHFLLAISNDNWFLRSVASRQHHALASWRAIEFKRFFVRTTNNGLSGIIDPLGRTIDEIPRFGEGSLRTDAVHLLSKKTLFQYVGGLPLIVFSIGIFLIACFWRNPS